MAQQHDAQQQILDYTSAINERLALIRSLEQLGACGYSPKRIESVIEILTRVALIAYGNDWVDRKPSELANLPSRSKVSERTVQNWSAHAEMLGVLEVERPSTRWGGHATARWRVRYSEISGAIRRARERHEFGGETGVKRGCNRGEEFSPPGGETVSPPPVFKYLNSTGPVPEEAPAGPVKFLNQGGSTAAPSGSRSDNQPRAGSPDLGTTATGQIDETRLELLQKHVDLHAASLRPVAPLPPGDCLERGIFRPLTIKDISGPRAFVEWFRRALGVPEPLFEPTEADAALVMAAAMHVIALPQHEVQSRIGLFGWICRQQQWRRCENRLGASLSNLSAFKQAFPECLTHPEGLGPRAHEAQTHEEART